MKNVLILEDNLKTLHALEKMVSQISRDNQVYLAKTYEEAGKLAFSRQIDVFILDIVLTTKHPGDVSGIHFANQLRKNENYLFTPIIFITALSDPELYAYKELRCFGFIEKPFAMDQAEVIIEKALKYTTPVEKDKILYFRKEGIIYAVRLDEVLYVEAYSHKLMIHMISDTLEIPYITIKQFSVEACKYGFFQCRRNIIVNKKFVKSIDLSNHIIQMARTNDLVDIGAAYRKRIKKELENA